MKTNRTKIQARIDEAIKEIAYTASKSKEKIEVKRSIAKFAGGFIAEGSDVLLMFTKSLKQNNLDRYVA